MSLPLRMYDIIASAAAKGDLEEIKGYLLTEFRNPQAVANLEAAIRRAYDTLAENPNAFPPCDDSRLRQKGYRKCVLTNYLFVYEVVEQANLVKVHRFFHGLQNWALYL